MKVLERKLAAIIVAGVALAFVLAFFLLSLASVPAGHVGVVTSFGKVTGEPLDPGLHVIPFWQSVTPTSLQTQQMTESADVPTNEGLNVHLEATILYSVKKDDTVDLYVNVGKNYKEVLIQKQFRSVMRGISTKYKAEDLYTAHRSEIEAEMEKSCRSLLKGRGIECEKILLCSITLPDIVRKAIEKKMASEQDAAAMQWVINKEKQEAERKRVEAKGIADSQNTIQGTLTDAYLRYLWIQSLKEASQHASSIIYVPTGHDGLPFFREASPAPAPEKKK